MPITIESMLFTNPTDHTIRLDSLGLGSVGPGQDIEIPLALAAPYRRDNGARGPSPIEQVAPQLKPKADADRAAWLEVPTLAPPTSRVVSVAARAPGEAPGVKALRDARAAQIAAEAKQAASQPAPAAPATPFTFPAK